jgi:hypothetical protein
MTDHDLVLVTGAGGVGCLVIERLRAQDMPVRVLVRREAVVVPGELTTPPQPAAHVGSARAWPRRGRVVGPRVSGGSALISRSRTLWQ